MAKKRKKKSSGYRRNLSPSPVYGQDKLKGIPEIEPSKPLYGLSDEELQEISDKEGANWYPAFEMLSDRRWRRKLVSGEFAEDIQEEVDKVAPPPEAEPPKSPGTVTEEDKRRTSVQPWELVQPYGAPPFDPGTSVFSPTAALEYGDRPEKLAKQEQRQRDEDQEKIDTLLANKPVSEWTEEEYEMMREHGSEVQKRKGRNKLRQERYTMKDDQGGKGKGGKAAQGGKAAGGKGKVTNPWYGIEGVPGSGRRQITKKQKKQLDTLIKNTPELQKRVKRAQGTLANKGGGGGMSWAQRQHLKWQEEREEAKDKAYGERYASIMKELRSIGEQAYEDIGQQFAKREAKMRQGLTSQGLAGTTVMQSMQAGLEEREADARARLAEKLARERAQTMTRFPVRPGM